MATNDLPYTVDSQKIRDAITVLGLNPDDVSEIHLDAGRNELVVIYAHDTNGRQITVTYAVYQKTSGRTLR